MDPATGIVASSFRLELTKPFVFHHSSPSPCYSTLSWTISLLADFLHKMSFSPGKKRVPPATGKPDALSPSPNNKVNKRSPAARSDSDPTPEKGLETMRRLQRRLVK